jgi:hypothetical protein
MASSSLGRLLDRSPPSHGPLKDSRDLDPDLFDLPATDGSCSGDRLEPLGGLSKLLRRLSKLGVLRRSMLRRSKLDDRFLSRQCLFLSKLLLLPRSKLAPLRRSKLGDLSLSKLGRRRSLSKLGGRRSSNPVDRWRPWLGDRDLSKLGGLSLGGERFLSGVLCRYGDLRPGEQCLVILPRSRSKLGCLGLSGDLSMLCLDLSMLCLDLSMLCLDLSRSGKRLGDIGCPLPLL